MTLTGRHLLLLGLIPLICGQAAATCYGNACPEQHETATAQGLAGDSLNAVNAASECSNKSYRAPEPIVTDTPILDLRWTGPLKRDDEAFDQYVFAITEGQGGFIGGHMWRSSDWGLKWKDITTEMAGASEGPISEEGVVDIIYHLSSPHNLLFLGPGFHLWTSNDFGDTFVELDTPGRTLGFWVDILPHPNQPDWLLARVRRNECLKYDGDTSKWCANDLFLSQDFAVTWTNLTATSNGRIAAFWDFDWGANMLHWNTSAGWKDETILATLYEDTNHLQGPYPGWDPNLHFVASHDFFASDHEKIAPCGNQFEILAHKIFLAMPASCSQAPNGSKRTVPKDATARNAVALYISDTEDMTYTEACLPTGLLDQGYNLIRTHDGTGVFAIVDHDERDEFSASAPMGSVYASGWNTSLFTFSMDRNYRREYMTDFVRIEWLPGGYMANQLSQEVFMDPDMMRRTGKSYEDFIQTKITFNGGAQWSDLETPDDADYNNQVCNQCKGMQDRSKCKLHLHGPTNWYSGPGARPSFYSHMSAPGFIMASGNTGEHLDFAADTTCTWLSSDGGLTWKDVADHTAIYEFGDHGSIVLLARHEAESPTDYVRFSTDYGNCWHRIDLPKALDVQNIRLEPSGKSHVFALHGQECRKSNAHPKCTMERNTPGWPKGMLYMLDITEILRQGEQDWPDCTETDYEPWSGPKPEMCQLGRNHTWSRVKPEVDCFNGKGWRGTVLDVTPCFCNHEDLECEYGYERRAGNSTCEAMQGIDPQQCPIIATGQYYVSESHLRLLHQDTCQQVERVLLDSDGQGHCMGDKCPGNQRDQGERSHWLRTASLLLLLVAGVVGTFFWWTRFASDSLKATIEESGAPVLACLGGCAGWVQDKFAQLTGRQRREAEGAYYDPLSGGDGGLNLDEEDARSPPLFPMGGGR